MDAVSTYIRQDDAVVVMVCTCINLDTKGEYSGQKCLFPYLTSEQFQRNETCCFLLTDPIKDLTKTADKYVTWVSRSA